MVLEKLNNRLNYGTPTYGSLWRWVDCQSRRSSRRGSLHYCRWLHSVYNWRATKWRKNCNWHDIYHFWCSSGSSNLVLKSGFDWALLMARQNRSLQTFLDKHGQLHANFLKSVELMRLVMSIPKQNHSLLRAEKREQKHTVLDYLPLFCQKIFFSCISP